LDERSEGTEDTSRTTRKILQFPRKKKCEEGDMKEKKKVRRQHKATGERAILAIIGAGITYFSGSETDSTLRVILFIGGIGFILYALFSD
jgi:hypothetical protein